ncbi:hypothetical protein BCT23_10540 [Enterovibrio norvegicus]|uniref:Uncharacterized protein n=1 Tax=Enterovibrio norvegicus TaxID=188144 RepID=A0A2N7LFP7_9GAMM|nr:hypothetical protein BCT23_10540 [Enterovibrio norvegicus]
MGHVFSEKIADSLGSEKIFYIICAFLAVFALCILIAMFKPSNQSKNDTIEELPDTSSKSQSESIKKDISVSYNDNSTHNGDNHF